MIKDALWWTSEADVKLDTIASLFTNALLHPIPLEENVNGNIVTNYYVYPKAYTDAFKTNTGIYEHVILPLSSNGDDGPTLFLF
jgi:hypothetical protein